MRLADPRTELERVSEAYARAGNVTPLRAVNEESA